MRVSHTQSKKRLAVLWFIGSGIAFLVVLFQTILGRYLGEADKAWSWFLPAVVPTLSLMIGVFVADTLNRRLSDKQVDKFMYNIAFGLSVTYFLIIYITIFMQPFSNISPFKLMQQSTLWLSPLQGLAAASLGAFFVKEQ